MTPTTVAGRLTKAERREQLLDAAAQVLLERGVVGVTMEGVAAAAGVSKALPYAHFENADAVLFAVYRRETENLVARVEAAVDRSESGDLQLRRAVAAFFDVVIERGALLAAFARSSIPADLDQGQRLGHRYVGDLLKRTVGLSGPMRRVVATMAFGAMWSAIESLSHRDARRPVVEEAAYQFILAGVRAAASQVP
ncbi:MAG: TetR/AcrR family transcriptional regulator [Acidimicrobiales bacterium]